MTAKFWIAAATAAAFSTIPVAARPGHAIAAAEAPARALRQLLDADRAYSSGARNRDMAGALAAIFAEDVVMVIPGKGFARGRAEAAAALEANPANRGAKADWAPISGGISADGLHGFTLGYFHLALADGSRRRSKYIAYWVRGKTGWRIALYRRTPMPEGAPIHDSLPQSLPVPGAGNGSYGRDRQALIAREAAFSADAARSGIGDAFRHFGSPTSINTGRSDYLLGAEAIAKEVASGVGEAPISWAAEDALVAASGDLGVTWGRIRIGNPPAGEAGIPYFTIWRLHADGWRYAAE